MVALGALALAAAAVSYQAQYAMVLAYKGSKIIAAVQAAIPDAGALVFASLGIALALQGKRAVRPRVLNVACVGISIAMNALAASAGWTAAAIWVMAPILYALASDTLVAVIRAWSIARQRELDGALADDDGSPLAIVGGACSGCCALPWRRGPRSAGSANGCWRKSESLRAASFRRPFPRAKLRALSRPLLRALPRSFRKAESGHYPRAKPGRGPMRNSSRKHAALPGRSASRIRTLTGAS